MNAKSLVRKAVVGIALVCISAGYVWADKLQLQARLSKDVEVQLRDVTIAEALEQIGKKAGVKFVLSDEAAWKLPQGEATRLSVMMQGPLAESMTEMLNAFFMRYAVGDEEITIYPRPELEHILGRPTAKQLELLKAIYTRPIRTYFLEKVQTSINEALGCEVLVSPIHVQAQLNNLLRQLVGKDPIYKQVRDRGRPTRVIIREVREPEADEPEATEYNLPTPVALVQLLSQVTIRDDPRNTRWYISGMDFLGQNPEIRVLDWSIFVGLKLNQKIDISYKDARLDKILQNLAGRAGVRLIVGPSSYLNEHKLSVSMQDITIEQAVLNIADMIGAGCEFRGSEIRLSVPGKPKDRSREPEKRKSARKDGGVDYVGKISIPMDGGKYYIEFMLREKDLTEELKRLREAKMKAILGESPKPAEKPKPAKSK